MGFGGERCQADITIEDDAEDKEEQEEKEKEGMS